MDTYQEFIYKRSYARWIDNEDRRENWEETVGRYENYMLPRVPSKLQSQYKNVIDGVRRQLVMPSMRALWSAGPALERDNITGYNCWYTEIDRPKAWAEILHVLMCGAGAGFSVERQVINRLPEVKPLAKIDNRPDVVFADSRIGWSKGFYEVIKHLYAGLLPTWDLSKIRPEGARLKVMGGRASGPEPLERLLKFAVQVFSAAEGRKLNSLECHDLACMVGNCVVSGGVRRSACISLSNLTDQRMRHAKVGDFPDYRHYSNNSVAYTEEPDVPIFLKEFISLIESRAGERGIFNRQAAEYQVASTNRRQVGYAWGCNPCGEVLLRPDEFCNLTEVVVKPDDSFAQLILKVEAATILGVVQSTLTDFKFINKASKLNCEEERLLGISLTGLADHHILGGLSGAKWFRDLKEVAIDTAKVWSGSLGINMPAAITCVKPSGTVSQLVGSSSGVHPRFAEYYLRRVEVAKTDPIAQMLIDQGCTCIDRNPTTYCFEWPIKSPPSSRVKDSMSALGQLDYWRMVKDNWCEHNASCTIYVKEKEWPGVISWVKDNWTTLTGVTFMPVDDTIYSYPPYEEIDEDTYHERLAKVPKIDYNKLSAYEVGDQTEGARELACVGGACEL